MSSFIAKIENIENIENLHIITFSCNNTQIKMMSLEINRDIQIGKKAILTCKPSSISLSKDFKNDVSISNRLKSKVLNILKGELLSIVTFDFAGFELESMFLTQILEEMDLKNGEEVIALVKESELFISECIDE